jgi:hypothetical protein
MQSDCLAISPNLICSYAWKAPDTPRELFIRAAASDEDKKRDTARTGHPSLPWKAYLALREFQHLASDLAEAFFARNEPALLGETSEPSVLTARSTEGSVPNGRGLLRPILCSQGEPLAA